MTGIRALGKGPEGESVHFLYYNLGKESITLDLKSDAGLAAAKALAARVDVVLESARPGVTERLGLGVEAVKALNPKVVYVSVSGFGQTGPRASDPLTDAVAQSFSGMISVNHGEDGVPHKLHTTIIDSITGILRVPGDDHGDVRRRVTEAKHIDVSLMQSAAAANGAEDPGVRVPRAYTDAAETHLPVPTRLPMDGSRSPW